MSDKWIRSINDNPAGKVVADPSGNRWEWDKTELDETARLLKKLQNDELSIEQTDMIQNPLGRGDSETGQSSDAAVARKITQKTKKIASDAGGGFNPYDNSGKPRRR